MNSSAQPQRRLLVACLWTNAAILLTFPASLMAFAFAAPVELVGARIMLQPAFGVPVVAVSGIVAYLLRSRFQKPALVVSVACATIGVVWSGYVVFAFWMFSHGVTAAGS